MVNPDAEQNDNLQTVAPTSSEKDAEQTSEHDAIVRLQNGDIASLEFLVHKYQLRAIRAAYFIVGERELAEDIVQDVFLRLYKKIGQYDTNRPFSAWLMRSVVNDAVKAVSRRSRTISLDITTETLIASLPDPAESAEFSDIQEQIQTALNQLPVEQRATIVMRYYLDLNETEISNLLECPTGTVKWRLHTARKQLQSLLRSLL